MKEYICECGKTFTDAQKFNGHKSHCVIHYNSVGKTYSMNDRVEKQKQTIIDKYGSKEEYSRQHGDSIKRASRIELTLQIILFQPLTEMNLFMITLMKISADHSCEKNIIYLAIT